MTNWKSISAVALASALGLTFAGIANADALRGADREAPTFEELDANSDGTVTAEEIQAFTTAKVAERFAEQDTNGDGSLDADELLAAFDGSDTTKAQERIARMITWADANDDGVLSLDELPQRDMTRHLSRLDTDNSGDISAEEYAAKPAPGERGGKGGKGGRGDHGDRGGKGGKGEGKGGRNNG